MAYLGQAGTAAMTSIFRIMYRGKKPARRLNAALEVIRIANEANEIEECAAAVVDAERIAQAGSLPAGMTGHGTKLPRKMQQAVAALLGERSVAHAARAAGISPQTLRHWMVDPVFSAAYALSACAVFGPAMRLAQQGMGDAVVLIRNFTHDPAIPEETRLQADLYIVDGLSATVLANLETRACETEPLPGPVAGRNGRNLHQKLARLKARLRPAQWGNVQDFEYIPAEEGRPAGTAASGSSGLHLCAKPPEISKKDDERVQNEPEARPEAA
jgi:hypothetical protein